MSIISQIERIGANISEAIDLLKEKGATLSSENSDSLVEGIDSILGVPIDVSFPSTMDNTLANATEADVGKMYRYSGNTTDAYENGAIYIIEKGQDDDMPFVFHKLNTSGGIIDVLKLPSNGGKPVIGTWTDGSGATLPTEVEVENIYLNTSLSKSEVVDILSGLTYRQEDGIEIIMAACGYDVSALRHVYVCFFRVDSIFGILAGRESEDGTNDISEWLFATGDGAAEELGFDGWNPNFDGTFAVNGVLGAPGVLVQNTINIDDQQNQYGCLMSLEPDFTPEDIDETAIYRITEYDNCEVYHRYGETSGQYLTLKQLAVSEGFTSCKVVYSVVDGLPENPDVSTVVAGFEYVHVYIHDDIPKVYGDIGNGNEWNTVVDVLAYHGLTSVNNGFTPKITGETATGLYFTYTEKIYLYYYKNNKWHGATHDRIIDVQTLPGASAVPVVGTWTDTENLPTEAKVGKIYLNTSYVFDRDKIQTVFGGDASARTGCDCGHVILASYVNASDGIRYNLVYTVNALVQAQSLYIYKADQILEENAEPEIMLYACEITSEMKGLDYIGWNPEFDGAIEVNGDLYAPGVIAGKVYDIDDYPDVPVTDDPSRYIDFMSLTPNFGVSEATIDKDAIYRLNTSAVEVYLVSNTSIMTYEMFWRALGGDVDVVYHLVDNLPSKMLKTSESLNEQTVIHIYILKHNAAMYMMTEGKDEPQEAIGSSNYVGWVDTIPTTPVASSSEGYMCAYRKPVTEYYVYKSGEFQQFLPPKEEIDLLSYTLNSDGTGYIVSCNDIDATGEIVVPATYNGLPVVEVAENGFTMSRASSLVLQDGILTVNNGAFCAMPRLRNLVLPDSITTMGGKSLCESGLLGWSCKLPYLRLPANLTETPSNLLSACEISTLIIPDSISKVIFYTCYEGQAGHIGRLIFEGTPSTMTFDIQWATPIIDEIYVPWSKGDFPEFDAVDFRGTKFYNYKTGDAMIAASNFTDYVTAIGFANRIGVTGVTNTEIKTIKIANFVTSIEEAAFKDCVLLASIEIPSSVLMIKPSVFEGCTALTSITYTGTKEGWKAMSFGASWDLNTPDYIVTCADGTIAKDGTET